MSENYVVQPAAIPVTLDQQCVRNTFLNLVSNALKYSPEGKPVDTTLEQRSDTVQVQIIDQGVGIPEDEHKHLFDLFFRARNATNIQGTGLGLPTLPDHNPQITGYLWIMIFKCTFVHEFYYPSQNPGPHSSATE